MPRRVVDLAARSTLFREQPLLSHAWVATPPEVLDFLRQPRSSLRKIGIRLAAGCVIETVLQNHDWLTGHSSGLTDASGISVFARGEGDGQRWYRVAFYATKSDRAAPERTLLHNPSDEERPVAQISPRTRDRADSLRRSFRAAPIYTDVHALLAPLTVSTPATKSTAEAHRVLQSIIEAASQFVAANPSVEPTLEALAASIQRNFHPGYAMLFRADRSADATFHQAYTGLLYAKALDLIATSGFQFDELLADVSGILADAEPALRLLSEAAEASNPDLLAHATAEATTRRRGDRRLDARLVEAEELFASYDPDATVRESRFGAPARRLELLSTDNRHEWWFLPSLVAYAIAIWPLRGEQATR
jgi:hypothetical protein